MRAFERWRHLGPIAAQGGVSLFHFSLNLALLRLVTPYDYGVFAFAFVLAMFATAVNHSLISTPLLVYTPVLADRRERRRQESLLASANLALAAALIGLGAAWALAGGRADATATAVTLFVAVYSLRQYSRSTGYAQLRPRVTAAGDLVYVGTGTVLVAALWLGAETLRVPLVLGALVLANLAAMGVERVGVARARRAADAAAGEANGADGADGAGEAARAAAPRFTLRGYGHIWEQSRWSLAGALTSLLVAQAHSLLITSTHGPDAFAPLAAGFVLFGPVRVALQTWQNTVKPELAIALAAERLDEVGEQVRRTVRLVLLAVGVLGIGLLVAWPLVHALLYARRYAEEPMAMIVGLWFLVTVAAASYSPPSAALQSMKDFRALAIPTIWAALASVVLVWVALRLYAPEATLFAVLAAETLVALWLPRLLRERLAARAGTAAMPSAAVAGGLR